MGTLLGLALMVAPAPGAGPERVPPPRLTEWQMDFGNVASGFAFDLDVWAGGGQVYFRRSLSFPAPPARHRDQEAVVLREAGFRVRIGTGATLVVEDFRGKPVERVRVAPHEGTRLGFKVPVARECSWEPVPAPARK